MNSLINKMKNVYSDYYINDNTYEIVTMLESKGDFATVHKIIDLNNKIVVLRELYDKSNEYGFTKENISSIIKSKEEFLRSLNKILYKCEIELYGLEDVDKTMDELMSKNYKRRTY